MMDLSDEDPFASSEEEAMETDCTRNPVEEHLLKQRHDVLERVERAKSNVEQMQELSGKILKKLHTKAICGESSGSDTEDDLYQVTGEPVIKKRRIRSSTGVQLLIVLNVWQKVINEKWIAGVVLENASNRYSENRRNY